MRDHYGVSLTGPKALLQAVCAVDEIMAPWPTKRDILAWTVAGCVAFNHRENETS
jgi:hypothetical protein